jgi:hypothetical protein
MTTNRDMRDKKAVAAYFKILSWHLPGENDENCG